MFLILKGGGSGSNLPGPDTVIFMIYVGGSGGGGPGNGQEHTVLRQKKYYPALE